MARIAEKPPHERFQVAVRISPRIPLAVRSTHMEEKPINFSCWHEAAIAGRVTASASGTEQTLWLVGKIPMRHWVLAAHLAPSRVVACLHTLCNNIKM